MLNFLLNKSWKEKEDDIDIGVAAELIDIVLLLSRGISAGVLTPSVGCSAFATKLSEAEFTREADEIVVKVATDVADRALEDFLLDEIDRSLKDKRILEDLLSRLCCK